MSQAFQLRDRTNCGTIISKKQMKSPVDFKQNCSFHSSCDNKTKQNFYWKENKSNVKDRSLTKQTKNYVEFQNSCSQLMKILLNENSNLKEQNIYLQKQLNKFIGKEKDLIETVMQYQSIMSILNAQNIRLHQEILYFSDNANQKVDKLKSTISKYIKNNNRFSQHQQYRLEQSDTFTKDQQFEERQEQPIKFKKNFSQKRFNNIVTSNKPEYKYLLTPSNLKHSCPFQALLQKCRHQQDPQKRKQMRAKLIDMTYQRSANY